MCKNMNKNTEPKNHQQVDIQGIQLKNDLNNYKESLPRKINDKQFDSLNLHRIIPAINTQNKTLNDICKLLDKDLNSIKQRNQQMQRYVEEEDEDHKAQKSTKFKSQIKTELFYFQKVNQNFDFQYDKIIQNKEVGYL
ncbi:hypothetical protein OXYTRIMIC_068 [Oxytricha trifallax]|uniref:Uncharacterized protein n=1 Tax=Oxytricha trifallax TaxID=1172189 RepID=A0A073HX46_9SPIT|nr:hypothetical protein OXYTRIMIC_068 [Oxytricha trifallax]